MNIIKNTDQILENLKQEGQSFKSFKLVSSGEFKPDDVDWNYKDMLHAAPVHELLSPAPIYISDYTLAAIFFQKFLIFRFPFVIFQYDSGPNELTYFFTLFSFSVVVNTKSIERNESITDVISTYNIGSKKILLNIFFPFIKWALTKNYKNLMVGDMQMRKRRGDLRKMGISFIKKNERYTFQETMTINKKNCVYNSSIFNSSSSSKILITEKNSSSIQGFLTGTSDPWGLRGVIIDDKLSLYPRMCDHEGACLDNATLKKTILSCPWHNKKIRPIYEISIASKNKFDMNYNGKNFLFIINRDSIKLNVS